MNFDKYLIPEAPSPASEGFLGNLSRVPTSEIRRMNALEVEHEIEALESYMDAIMSTLTTPIAMESEGETDNLSNIAAKARAAGQKIKEGKKENNPSLVNQGTNELTASMQELNQESAKAKDPKTKSKVWMVAKVIGAVVATVLLAAGAVKAGKALSAGVKSNSPKAFVDGSKEAKRTASVRQTQDSLGELGKKVAEADRLTRELHESGKRQDAALRELEKNITTLASMMEKTSQNASKGASSSATVYKASEIHTHEDFDRMMKDKNSVLSFESYTAFDYEMAALEAMIELSTTDLFMMNLAAMEATGDDIDQTSSDLAQKARDAYGRFKSAKNESEKARASMELDSIAKQTVAESNKAKDPGSKARWKKVAKIIGAIAASVALIGGAVVLSKTIKNKNNNTNPMQAAADMQNATNAAKKVATASAQKEQPKQQQSTTQNQNQSQNQQTHQQSQQKQADSQTQQQSSASTQSSQQSTGPDLTDAQKRDVAQLKHQMDELKKKRNAFIKEQRAAGKAIDTTEGTDAHRQIAEMTNARDALMKKLFDMYGVRYN